MLIEVSASVDLDKVLGVSLDVSLGLSLGVGRSEGLGVGAGGRANTSSNCFLNIF